MAVRLPGARECAILFSAKDYDSKIGFGVSVGTKWRGHSRFLTMPRKGLALVLQVLDFGRNHFLLILRQFLTLHLAVMQVAIDPNEPAFGTFLNYFHGPVHGSDHEVPLGIFLRSWWPR